MSFRLEFTVASWILETRVLCTGKAKMDSKIHVELRDSSSYSFFLHSFFLFSIFILFFSFFPAIPHSKPQSPFLHLLLHQLSSPPSSPFLNIKTHFWKTQTQKSQSQHRSESLSFWVCWSRHRSSLDLLFSGSVVSGVIVVCFLFVRTYVNHVRNICHYFM